MFSFTAALEEKKNKKIVELEAGILNLRVNLEAVKSK
jgi:hypothetical protein